jgi:carboxyvinyl-carboxyphosphonate phosphorylmutase
VKRAKAFAATGVDAVFLVGVESADQVKAVHEAAQLPVMVGSAPPSIKREEFAAAGARVLLQGHQPLPAAVKALKEVYTHLYNGGTPGELKDKIASAKEMDALLSGEAYKKRQREFLR